MGRQGRARVVAVAGDDVEGAGGKTDLLGQLGQHQGAQRCVLGRLEHYGAAGCQRRSDLPGGHQQRKVPGNDGADHADGFAAGVGHQLAFIGDRWDRGGHGATFDLGRPAGGVAQEVHAQGDVHMTRECDGLAVVEAAQAQTRQHVGRRGQGARGGRVALERAGV